MSHIYSTINYGGALHFSAGGDGRGITEKPMNRLSIDGYGRIVQANKGKHRRARVFLGNSVNTGSGVRLEVQNLTNGNGLHVLPEDRRFLAKHVNGSLFENGTLIVSQRFADKFFLGIIYDCFNGLKSTEGCIQ